MVESPREFYGALHTVSSMSAMQCPTAKPAIFKPIPIRRTSSENFTIVEAGGVIIDMQEAAIGGSLSPMAHVKAKRPVPPPDSDSINSMMCALQALELISRSMIT